MDKELKKIAKALEAQGFETRISKRGHMIVSHDGRIVATFSGTASDWRSMRNSIADARRAGFKWPPER
ncbi:YjbF family lipoprotein [Homoserinibacter sp. GY 40078]|uniref:YjbF family lipoprotein n=1 Tax=Homoserinibacter sp. GY 40078 TaxID=2603275 RepID=UPI0011C772DB|nr:YjbF family lipoprotein [Homoserinibacter sp. GY 40078]TXK17420.1 YjbF family lipoprotein [Homoserinibacter sp. GY 40078]